MLFAALLLIAYIDARQRGDLRGVAGSVWATASALIALGVAQIIGNAVDRTRPYDAMTGVHVLIDRTKDFSFPSDHATVVGAVAMGLLLAGGSSARPADRPVSRPADRPVSRPADRPDSRLAHRRWGIAAAALAVLMAFARVYVGTHYVGDVLAGLALGALVSYAGWLLLARPLESAAASLARTRARPLVSAAAS